MVTLIMIIFIISFFIQVKAVLAELKTNKKIATATHNILAYRYYTIGTCSYTLPITTKNREYFLSTYLHVVKCLSLNNLQDVQILVIL